MHKFSMLLFLLLTSLGKLSSQITLETTYPGADRKLYMVNLEVSGPKYVLKSEVPNNRYLKFYNLDHSLWKTIDCNNMPIAQYCMPGVDPAHQNIFYDLYITENLFNCDDDLEFMYVSTAECHWVTGIYNEHGEALLLADSCAPLVRTSVPQHFRPIYNTPEGTKMILSKRNGEARVYNLPCTLSSDIHQYSPSEFSSLLSIYPNPSLAETVIKYSLPVGSSKAEIILFDNSGQLIKTFQIDNNFSELIINSSDYPSGTYLYSLVVDGVFIESKRIIKID